MTHQPNNVSAAGVLSDTVAVPRAPIEWLKTHYPALCEKAGLCERIGGRLYTRTVAAASDQATGRAVQGERPDPTDIQGWSVTVNVNAQDILTIGHNSLSGIDNIDDFAQIVRDCAEHLASFIGSEPAAAPSPAAREAGDGVKLTDEQREELSFIERCNPDFLIMHIEQDTNYDAKLLARVFDLAKEQSRALLREAGSR